MSECCKNCGHRMNLIKFDYSQGGCAHSNYEGWACTIFEIEGSVVHMIGLDINKAHCEMWAERRSDESDT